MAGARNKKQRKKLRKFYRARRKDLELKALLNPSAVTKKLVEIYAEAEQRNKR